LAEADKQTTSLRPLLFILLALLAAVALYALNQRRAHEQAPLAADEDGWTVRDPKDLPPWERPLPEGSVDPPVHEEFDVQVEFRHEGPRNVVYFFITERHGFLADGVYVDFWHQHQDPDTGEWVQDSPPISFLCRQRLEFGGSLTDNTTLTELELEEIHTDLGASENWAARVPGCRRIKARGAG